MKILIIALFIIFLNLSNTFGQIPCNYVKGELIIGVDEKLFNFPDDYYGAKINYMPQTNSFKIDSIYNIVLKKNAFLIDSEKIVSYDAQKVIDPGLSKKISLNLNNELTTLFKDIGVYYVGRTVKRLSPDSIQHELKNRLGETVTRKRFNANTRLLIKFRSEVDVYEVTDKLISINGIRYALPNEILKEFGQPDDALYPTYQQTYMSSLMMNFGIHPVNYIFPDSWRLC